MGKQPKQTAIYEKSEPIVGWDVPLPISNYPLRTGTRIEVRLWSKKIPIRSLSEVEKLKFMNPFEHLRLDLPNLGIIQDLTGSKRYMVAGFLRDMDYLGMLGARRLAGKHRRNFKRDISPYLVELDWFSLEEAWEKRMNKVLSLPSAMTSLGNDWGESNGE
jgi:hypothetical protein